MKSLLNRVAVCHFVVFAIALAPIQLHGQETVTAQKAKLQKSVNLPGIFVADDKDEIKMEPEKYRGDLIVTKILPEGIRVKKGDTLIEFDRDKLDEAIQEAQNEATDANVELKKADAEYQSAQIDLESKLSELKTNLKFLERDVAAAIAKQELEMAKKEKSLLDQEQGLIDRETDFDTLKKIYQERNLKTSNSGDILVEREEYSLNNAKKQIAFLKKEIEYFKKFDRSKDQLDKELAVQKKQAEIKQQKVTLEAKVIEKKAVVEKAQRKLDAANKKVAGLQLDLENLRVDSPRDGVLFYGQTGQEMPAGIVIMGNVSGDVRSNLKIGGRVSTHRILLTVSEMDQLSIKMSVAEDDIQHIRDELAITVYPDAFPGEDFAGELTSVDQIATKIGFTSSERRFKVMGKCTEAAPLLRSGMNCRVQIHVEDPTTTITLPISCLAKDPAEDQFVVFVKSNGKDEKRVVKIGESNAETVQILDGVSENDEVYVHPPSKN